MTRAIEPNTLWWTADALVEAHLPGMPGSKRGVNLKADQEGWRTRPGCARRRKGRGGGWQYHWSVLPEVAQRKLLKDAVDAPEIRFDRGDAWTVYDKLSAKAKAKAETRLVILSEVEVLRAAGTTQAVAVNTVSETFGVSPRSVFNWLAMVEGVAVEDRLAYLAPRHTVAKRPAQTSADKRTFLEHLKSLYLRLEQPTFKQCYRDVMRMATAEGWATLQERTAWRHIEREVPRVTMVYRRQGEAGLQRCFPAQIRDRSTMTALEGVNADCHKIDVFVEWPDGTIDRPQIVAFQDLYSNKMLSWRVDHDPNKVMVMAAFGELIEQWGIPRHCLFDNGREFANKWMTGGAPTRFRFKIREDDPLGVLPLLGVKLHWATPAHGQAKPIERGFRDFASDMAKDVRFEGAYVGNKPTAKPENYQSRAIPLETFLRVVEERFAEHNARQGRLNPTANGRSFDDTFAESYATAAIQKATEEQRRLWMMGQHLGKLHASNGSLKFQGNVYHSTWMSQLAGTEVVARFDPEDLHAGVHLYSKTGEHLGFAECQQAVGFFDIIGAKSQAKKRSRIRRAEKDLAAAHATIPTSDLAAKLDATAPASSDKLDAKVVAPIQFNAHRVSKRKAATPVQDPQVQATRDAMVVQMNTAAEKAKPKTNRQTPEGRFQEALDILERSEAGKDIGEAEAKWWLSYKEHPEFKMMMTMREHKREGDAG
ncbi:transposase domain-containing protein [Ascidiaceihabitans sp.]|uniref:transposase domain-containing protein n=1 Tax=Ascidiaceihabitans sp. TaxID=1872644 RepID=UPI00329A0692